jgi:hypothetical protein
MGERRGIDEIAAYCKINSEVDDLPHHKPGSMPEKSVTLPTRIEDKNWYQSTIYRAQVIIEFVHRSLALRFCVEARHDSASGILLINARSQSERGMAKREENFAGSKVVLEAMGHASSSREQ